MELNIVTSTRAHRVSNKLLSNAFTILWRAKQINYEFPMERPVSQVQPKHFKYIYTILMPFDALKCVFDFLSFQFCKDISIFNCGSNKWLIIILNSFDHIRTHRTRALISHVQKKKMNNKK